MRVLLSALDTQRRPVSALKRIDLHDILRTTFITSARCYESQKYRNRKSGEDWTKVIKKSYLDDGSTFRNGSQRELLDRVYFQTLSESVDEGESLSEDKSHFKSRRKIFQQGNEAQQGARNGVVDEGNGKEKTSHVLKDVLASLFPPYAPKKIPPKTPRLDFDALDDVVDLAKAKDQAELLKSQYHNAYGKGLKHFNSPYGVQQFKQQTMELEKQSQSRLLTVLNIGPTALEDDIRKSVPLKTGKLEGWSEGMLGIRTGGHPWYNELKGRRLIVRSVVAARDVHCNQLPYFILHFSSARAAQLWKRSFLTSYHDGTMLENNHIVFIDNNIPSQPSLIQGLPDWIPNKFSKNHLPVIFNGGGGLNRTVKVSVAKLHWADINYFITDIVLSDGQYVRSLLPCKHGIEITRNLRQKFRGKSDLEGVEWLIRFKEGCGNEAHRLVREWDMKWVKMETAAGHEYWTRIEAEVVW